MLNVLKSIAQWSPIPLTKNQLYDVQIRKIVQSVLRSDSNCIDIGSSGGEYLDLMCKRAPEGIHFGFEPIPDLYEKLNQKYLYRANCHVSDIALCDEKGATHFNYVITNPSYSGLKKRSYDSDKERDVQLLVHTDLLDNRIPEDLKVDLIRMDVEGAELLVLRGARRIVSNDRPVVIFKHVYGASDHYGYTPGHLYEFFEEYEMCICSLSAFLNGRAMLSKEDLEEQFYSGQNEFFVAYPA